MQRDEALEEHRFRVRDILDGLPWHWLWQEAGKVARMASLEGHADLAVGLEPADARSVTGPADRPSREGPTARFSRYKSRRVVSSAADLLVLAFFRADS
jgi:hypothetical protein